MGYIVPLSILWYIIVYGGYIMVDRIWGIWGSYSNRPRAIFYLLKAHYRAWDSECFGWSPCRGLHK